MDNTTLITALLILWCMEDVVDYYIDFGAALTKRALTTNLGIGRGKSKKPHQRIFDSRDRFHEFEQHPEQYKTNLRISQTEFHEVLHGINPASFKKYGFKTTALSFENQVLLTLQWICEYSRYVTLQEQFGVSNFIVSRTINSMVPILVEYFIQFIPHKLISTKTSMLSTCIKYVIDGTIHPINRPQVDQRKYYRKDYARHFVQTQLLVDFDGNIIDVATNYPGHLHDSTMAKYNPIFKYIVGQNFALSDPGFGNVDYVVCGLTAPQLRSDNDILFDAISRHEQVIVEHVNDWFKSCKSVAKTTVFRHSTTLLAGCVLICCGLYNFKRLNGHFQ